MGGNSVLLYRNDRGQVQNHTPPVARHDNHSRVGSWYKLSAHTYSVYPTVVCHGTMCGATEEEDTGLTPTGSQVWLGGIIGVEGEQSTQRQRGSERNLAWGHHGGLPGVGDNQCLLPPLTHGPMPHTSNQGLKSFDSYMPDIFLQVALASGLSEKVA